MSPVNADYARRAIAATPDGFWLKTVPLTAEQVAALADGTDVLILWSGGNGPHRYTIHRDDGHGGPFAAMPEGTRGRDAWWTRPIDFVGDDRPRTVVWLLGRAPFLSSTG